MGGSLQPAGTCETVQERVPQYAILPPGAKGYLQEKVEFALKFPRIGSIRLSDGSTATTFLKQIVVTQAIRVEERIAKFWWRYKAEVNFDMWESRLTRGGVPPIPFLSDEAMPQPGGRRHSTNPFPPGRRPGALRRPDVVVVERPMDRWPGRGVIDREGGPHVDNLLRLVEIKFPGDDWGPGQEADYQLIAGEFKERMSVIDVSDCNGELEKVRQRVLKDVPMRETEQQKKRERVPIRTVEPIPHPVWYEDWWNWVERHGEEAGEAVGEGAAALWDATKRGYAYVSEETSRFLHEHAPWLFTAGRWVLNKATETWEWFDEQGRRIAAYTAAQLKAGWEALKREADLTWETLKAIDWGQVGITIVKALVVIVIVVAAVAIAIVIAEALLAILAALVAIIAAGAEAVAALAALLGITTAEAAASVAIAPALAAG
ncbi:VRR-NUC domain-containing protein [Burkholderia sp. AU33545]|uniref:VRR-NUC domain-containing protein n=1 Tax=Burkholderia sp. AU33545 TaxID=2879631 RepID=UPI001CF28A65|nr:VRR-NUC domain-containing protein [Burkholderia sp. AU33545]MCA8205164.1 VRR-NUC domain-containing protein [Burkholderia sp. AU33545]